MVALIENKKELAHFENGGYIEPECCSTRTHLGQVAEKQLPFDSKRRLASLALRERKLRNMSYLLPGNQEKTSFGVPHFDTHSNPWFMGKARHSDQVV